jgi:serine/threonine protein kinase
MACALYHAHVLGLLFRDVRPELVLLDPHGRARFCDLGVGKVLSDDPRLIAAGLAPDTPAYLAPEQVRGNRMAGRRADLYGLGATLFRMLCGRCPYEGSPAELSARILSQDPPDPATIVPDLSPGSRELLKRLLARNPEDRPSEADDVVAELDKLLAPRGQPADKLLELAAQLSEPHVEAAPAGAPAAQPGAAQPPPASPPTPAPLPHLLSIPRPRPRR